MKLNLKLVAAILIVSSSIVSGQFRAPEDVYHYMIKRYDQYLGETAPNCQLMDIDGELHNLHDFNHKLVILDFWATWCSGCIKGIPASNGVYDRLKSNGYTDIEWIYVSVDADTANWKNMVMSKEMKGYSLLASVDLAKEEFHFVGFPTYIVLDSNMQILGFDIQKPNEKGGLLEYTLCQAYNGKTAGEAFQSAFEKGNDGYYYPSQHYKDWDDTYINVYDRKE